MPLSLAQRIYSFGSGPLLDHNTTRWSLWVPMKPGNLGPRTQPHAFMVAPLGARSSRISVHAGSGMPI